MAGHYLRGGSRVAIRPKDRTFNGTVTGISELEILVFNRIEGMALGSNH